MSSIKIITSPSVYVVGRQQIDDTELSRFLADEDVERWTTDTEEAGQKLVEVAGRCCYWSFAKPRPGGNAAYIGHLLDVAHGSCLEHAVFSLIITGVSRSLTHEMVRHRVGISPSQLSQRYVDEGGSGEKPLDVVMPPFILACRDRSYRGHHWGVDEAEDRARVLDNNLPAKWRAAAEMAARAYRELDMLIAERLSLPDLVHAVANKADRLKQAREAARSVLPNATETKIFITANARALRNFLELRGSRHADAEINRLSLAMLTVLQGAAPNIFGDYRIEDVGNGVREIVTDHRKV